MCVGVSDNLASSADFAVINTEPSYAPDTVIKPIHLEIHLSFDLESQKINALVKQTFENPVKANEAIPKARARSIRLNAIGFLNLQISGVEKPVNHSYDGKHIELVWDDYFQAEEKRIVEFKYLIEKPIAGFYFQVPDKDYPDKVLHCITDHEPERARYWLPCVDFPVVRTTLDFFLKCPKSMEAIANGAFINEEIQDEWKIVNYRLDVAPCPSYLICIAVGNYLSVPEESVGNLKIKYFAPKGTNPNDLKRSFDKTPEMIKWITKKLDFEFPWPKYYQVCSPLIRGAMENISLVSWNDIYVLDEINAKERKMLVDQVNLHEMAHTYFGDLVVIRHFEHTWLKEAWATYMESVWIQDHFNADEFRFEMIENARSYISETDRYVRPIVTRVYDCSWNMFDGHTYPGGAWRIHMLRRLLGNQLFWSAVQKYLKQYANHVVETEDFKKCLENESGLNLTKFFDQWFYGKGFPKLKGSCKFSAENSVFQISFEQQQSWQVFDFILQVIVVDSEGNPHELEFVFDGKKEASANLNLGKAKPHLIRVDPNCNILFSLDFNAGEDLLKNTASEATDVFNRIWAFEELVKIASSSSLDFVKNNIFKEAFYGVRCKVAVALGKVNTRAAHLILSQMLREEQDPRVMWSITKSMNKKDEFFRDALLEFVGKKNQPYRALASAFESIGLQQNEQDLELLITLSHDEQYFGQYGMVRSGIFRGIGKFRNMRAFDYLKSRLPRSLEYERCRAVIVEALAECVEWHEKRFRQEATDIFANLLTDPNIWIRKSAMFALCDLNAAEYFKDIEATKSLYADQEWVFFHRKLKRTRENLKDSALEKIKEMQKIIGELEAKVKQIEQKQSELTIKSS